MIFNFFSKSKSNGGQPKREDSAFAERQTVVPNPHKVTREDLLSMTRKERMRLIVEIRAINKGMTVEEFNEEVDKGRALKYGVDYDRWQGMSEQERTVFKARENAAKKGMTLEEAKADYDSRMSERCKITIEEWQNMSRHDQINLLRKKKVERLSKECQIECETTGRT